VKSTALPANLGFRVDCFMTRGYLSGKSLRTPDSMQSTRQGVQGVQPHPKSLELVKIRSKSPKIRAKCEEIRAKSVPTFAKLLYVRLFYENDTQNESEDVFGGQVCGKSAASPMQLKIVNLNYSNVSKNKLESIKTLHKNSYKFHIAQMCLNQSIKKSFS